MKKIFAKRSLGQNFLVDPNYRRKIVEAVRRAYQGGPILEIGPGQGSLTESLSQFAESLVLVEKDAAFAQALKERFSRQQNVQIVGGDFLDWNFDELKNKKTLVVGNLPYNVSTQILIRLLQNMNLFSVLFLMFQKEVATRCAALSGNKDYGILSIWVRLFAEPRRLFDVPPSAFKPQPKITSTILEFKPSGRLYNAAEQRFIDFIKLVFSQRRKKIGSLLRGREEYNLAHLLKNSELRSYLDDRAEAVSLQVMRQMFRELLPIADFQD